MEITFTREELSKYANELETWYAKRYMTVMDITLREFDSFRPEMNKSIVQRALKDFDEKNRKPDWKTLL